MKAINGPDEDTCHALTSESSCQGLSGCSWCISAAVKPACHTIENAQALPPAVFTCSPLSEEPTEALGEVKDMNWGHSRHHRDHRRHHGHCAAPIIILALIVTHFVFMSKLAQAQESSEKLNGTFTSEPWSCKQVKDFRRNKRVAVSPVVEHSNITHANIAVNNNMA